MLVRFHSLDQLELAHMFCLYISHHGDLAVVVPNGPWGPLLGFILFYLYSLVLQFQWKDPHDLGKEKLLG